MGFKVKQFEKIMRIEPLLAMPAIGKRNLHVLQHGHGQKRFRNLKRAVDAGMNQAVRGKSADRPIAEPDLSIVLSVKTRDDVDAGGLSGAVGADEPENLAGVQMELQAVERPKSAKALDQARDLQERLRLRGHRCPNAAKEKRGRSAETERGR